MLNTRARNIRFPSGRPKGLALFRRAWSLRISGAVLGIFALLAQFSLPWAHAAAMATNFGQRSEAQTARYYAGFPICLASRSGVPDTPADPSAPLHKSAPCSICQATHMLGSLVPPNGSAVIEAPPAAEPGLVTRASPIVLRELYTTSQPRAPPVIA